MEEFKKADNLYKTLNVTFVNEISQDRGGISREFFQQIFT